MVCEGKSIALNQDKGGAGKLSKEDAMYTSKVEGTRRGELTGKGVKRHRGNKSELGEMELGARKGGNVRGGQMHAYIGR